MALAETVVIGLTFAVLKGLAKVAAGDDKLVSELASGGLDTAKKAIEDFRKGGGASVAPHSTVQSGLNAERA